VAAIFFLLEYVVKQQELLLKRNGAAFVWIRIRNFGFLRISPF